jgi:hypothetical protein
MKSRLLVVLSLGLASLLAACGGGAPETSAPPAGGGTDAAPTSAPAQPTGAPAQSGGLASSAGMDVSTINLCQLLPRAELAALAGGTPYEGAEPGGPACIYTIDPGDGTAELYSMSVTTPDLVAPMIDYVRQYEEAEWLEGIGDAAYLQPSDLGEGHGMVVLVEGKYGLSLSGPQAELLQVAARLIVERLGE